MSAALETISAPATTLLDSLSCADPTATDLRTRAAFWREYLRTTPNLSADQIARLEASCMALLARADRMDAPAPVVELRTSRTKPDSVRVSRAAKPAALTAERFWDLHRDAVQAIRTMHGPRWDIHAPLSDTVAVTVPAKLCAMTGPLGGKIKWRRDHRVPSGKYWPGGALPDCGLEVAPPVGERKPLPGAGMAAIIAHQIIADRQHDERALMCSPSWPPMERDSAFDRAWCSVTKPARRR